MIGGMARGSVEPRRMRSTAGPPSPVQVVALENLAAEVVIFLVRALGRGASMQRRQLRWLGGASGRAAGVESHRGSAASS